MRRRLLLGLAVLVLLASAIALVTLSVGRTDSVNARSIGRLKLGMTEKQVEDVLGRPADSDAVIPREENGQLKKYAAKEWVGPVRAVRVAFDDGGKVMTISEAVPPSRGVFGYFDRLREWIGF